MRDHLERAHQLIAEGSPELAMYELKDAFKAQGHIAGQNRLVRHVSELAISLYLDAVDRPQSVGA